MSGSNKPKDQPPKGAEHQPDAVKARKQRRFRAFMAELGPRSTGSAAQRRRSRR